jgi:hypothetical protein
LLVYDVLTTDCRVGDSQDLSPGSDEKTLASGMIKSAWEGQDNGMSEEEFENPTGVALAFNLAVRGTSISTCNRFISWLYFAYT